MRIEASVLLNCFFGMSVTISNLMPHTVIVLFTTVMIQTCKPGSSLFSYHPVCMTFAFTVCMTEAILVLNKNSIFGVFSRDKRILAHWVLLCFGTLMEIAGFYAIYTNKMINDKPHFTSWHGLIGLITVILSCFQLSMGAFAKYPRLLSPVVKMKNVKFAHALFGGFVYLLGVVTIVISFYSAFSIGAFSRFIWILLFSAQLVLGFIVLRGVSSSYLPKLFR